MRYQLTVTLEPAQPQLTDPPQSVRQAGSKQRLQDDFTRMERRLRQETALWPRRSSRTPMRLTILLKAAAGEGGERWSLSVCGPKGRVSDLYQILAPWATPPRRKKRP